MDETNESKFSNKGTSYEVAREIFSLDIQDSTESYPKSPPAVPTYSVDKIMTPGLSDKGDNTAVSEPTIIQVAPETVQPKSQAKRSWVFTQGYGKRVYDNDVMLIQCQVPGCGRYFKANRGSTSSISYHLLAAHEIPEYPGKPKRTKRKPTQTRKASFKAPQGMFDPKILEFSPLGVRVANLESKSDTLVQNAADKEMIPISMVQDRSLLHLLQLSDLDSENVALLPTDHQTSQFINGSFLDCRGQIRELLNKQDSLSLSITHCSGFFPVTAHFLSDDWSAREVLLCMLDPKETATGAEMGKRLIEALDNFQISSKVFTITTDFSTQMLVLADELFRISTMRKDFKFSPHQHIPCIGHIVNEVVNGILKSNLDGDNPMLPIASSPEAHHGSILAKLSSVRQGITAIRENPAKLGHYQNYFNQHQIKYQELVLDTAGNWESTFAMLEGVVANQLAFNSVCATYDMVEYILSPEDISFFEEVKTFLGLFQAFSSRVSSSRYPTISKVMLLYDKMLIYLDSMPSQKPPFLQKVFLLARKTLNSYFGKGLDNYIFPIAVAMDPRLKFAFWKPPIYTYEDCEFLKSMVRQYWESHFSQPKSRPETSLLPQTGFDEVFGVDTSSVSDELTRYIQESPVSSGFVNEAEIWDFWRRSSQSFPLLSKMARKFLAIPVASKPCERRLVHSQTLMAPTHPSMDSQFFLQQFSLLRSWRALLN